MTASDRFLIDGMQYCNWSEKIFRELHASGVTAIHVTICYHENFRETVLNIEAWKVLVPPRRTHRRNQTGLPAVGKVRRSTLPW